MFIPLDEKETGKLLQSLTNHVVQGRRGVRGTFAVLRLVKMAALVIHTAALELTEQVEEAVFIGGVPAQLLHGERQTQQQRSVCFYSHQQLKL